MIQGLMDLAKTAKSEMAKHNALQTLAKILGLTKEQLEAPGGLTVIFEKSEGPAETPVKPVSPAGPGAPGQPPPALPGLGKPIMITH